MTIFSAVVGDWAHKVEDALLVVFQESSQELSSQIDGVLVTMIYGTEEAVLPQRGDYKRTGFLRASVVASREAMPLANRKNPGFPVPYSDTDIVAEIQGLEMGDVLYIGMTAEYAPYVHYGANGAKPRPWMTIAAQRWEQIVAEQAARVRQRMGL